jgi:hypothetical protein
LWTASDLGLTHSVAAAVGASSAAISASNGWNHEGIQEKHCGSEDEKYTFHEFSPLWDCQVVRDNFTALGKLTNSRQLIERSEFVTK